VAVSAILPIAIWLFFAFFYPLIYTSIINNAESIESLQSAVMLTRISPIYLFNESMTVTLFPEIRSTSQLLLIITTDIGNYLLATPLSLWQSFLSVWPQVVITIVLTAFCFAASYIKFMFEEIRSL